MTTERTGAPAVEIDAQGLHYRPLNQQVRSAVAGGCGHVVVRNVCGQRYIGSGIQTRAVIELFGTPGNDLAAFMDGPTVIVHGNGQDGVGNTMSSGEVVIHGSAGDLLAHSFRGGRIFVLGHAGYRCAIHMKQYTEPVPIIVVGGSVGDYAGEYMAGGVLIVLGLGRRAGEPLAGRWLGTGMHNGMIYLRGDVEDHQMGAEISRAELDDADRQRLAGAVRPFAEHFQMDAAEILDASFTKFVATSARPYGNLYVY